LLPSLTSGRACPHGWVSLPPPRLPQRDVSTFEAGCKGRKRDIRGRSIPLPPPDGQAGKPFWPQSREASSRPSRPHCRGCPGQLTPEKKARPFDNLGKPDRAVPGGSRGTQGRRSHQVSAIQFRQLLGSDQPRIRSRRMERLWSPAGATNGKHWQIGGPPKPLKQAISVAVGCDWLPQASNGKEGVDGSSPSEGSAKYPQIGDFVFYLTCMISNVR
jgi:hypothetical protein